MHQQKKNIHVDGKGRKNSAVVSSKGPFAAASEIPASLPNQTTPANISLGTYNLNRRKNSELIPSARQKEALYAKLGVASSYAARNTEDDIIVSEANTNEPDLQARHLIDRNKRTKTNSAD